MVECGERRAGFEKLVKVGVQSLTLELLPVEEWINGVNPFEICYVLFSLVGVPRQPEGQASGDY